MIRLAIAAHDYRLFPKIESKLKRKKNISIQHNFNGGRWYDRVSLTYNFRFLTSHFSLFVDIFLFSFLILRFFYVVAVVVYT